MDWDGEQTMDWDDGRVEEDGERSQDERCAADGADDADSDVGSAFFGATRSKKRNFTEIHMNKLNVINDATFGQIRN